MKALSIVCLFALWAEICSFTDSPWVLATGVNYLTITDHSSGQWMNLLLLQYAILLVIFASTNKLTITMCQALLFSAATKHQTKLGKHVLRKCIPSTRKYCRQVARQIILWLFFFVTYIPNRMLFWVINFCVKCGS